MVWGRDVMDFFCHTKYIERESSVQVALAARELVAGRNSNREKLLFCSVLFFPFSFFHIHVLCPYFFRRHRLNSLLNIPYSILRTPYSVVCPTVERTAIFLFFFYDFVHAHC